MNFLRPISKMFKDGTKLQPIILCCLLGTWQTKVLPQSAADSAAAHSIIRLSLAEAYACTLNVWNKEIRPGSQDVKLNAFQLRVEAFYLGTDSAAASSVNTSQRFRFWLHRLDLQYLPDWQLSSDQQDSSSARSDWHKLKIRMNANRELALQQLTAQDTMVRIDIHSTIAMSRNDLMRIGVFNFQPEAPGLYELRFQLKRKQRLVFDSRQRLAFFCPPERPQLVLVKDGALHEVSNASTHIPLVASTFFELQSSTPNQNETDRLFRSIFWGFMSKRLACTALPASLLALDDFTSGLDSAVRLQLAQQRADFLLQLLAAKVPGRQQNLPCENLLGQRNHEFSSRADDSSCRHAAGIRLATAGETRYYLKANESEVSPQWFAEENRVAPLVASPEVQRIIFEPIAIKPVEESDYIEFHCTGQLHEAASACLRGGVIEVTNAAGAQCRQEIAAEVLMRAWRGEGTLRLDAPQMNAFLTAGEYSAVLKFPGAFPAAAMTSTAVRFRVTRKQIVRDEVFALSPYDRVDLTYEFDRERVGRISRDVITAAQKNPEHSTQEILILITGHSDSLGEHRAQDVGRHYNLGLSFGRALHLKKIFLDSLARYAPQHGCTIRTVRQQIVIPPVLVESIRKHLTGIMETGHAKLANGSVAPAGSRDDHIENYLNLVLHEKARHFRLRAEDSLPAPMPSATEILARCAALRPLIPIEIITIEISAPAAKRFLTIVSAGLGAAVPFYRKLELSEELREVFCRMDYRAEEMPGHLFGRDLYPAGRLMNRRVELNVIW